VKWSDRVEKGTEYLRLVMEPAVVEKNSTKMSQGTVTCETVD
jgi:hypothetical protein